MLSIRNLIDLLIICLAASVSIETQAVEVPSKPLSLLIGVESNRKPYTYSDAKQHSQGLIVRAVTTFCQTLNIQCKFVGKEFDELIGDLRNIKLNAVVVIDKVLPPDAQDLTLTQPVCQIKPAFIQKKSGSTRTDPSAFKGAYMGVLENSILQTYLSSNYPVAIHTIGSPDKKHQDRINLKLYPTLEAAITDLVFNRLDAVIADEAFFNDRVFGSALGKQEGLIVTHLDNAKLAAPSMVLALRKQDINLFDQLTKALSVTRKNQTCSQVLAKNTAKPAKNND